MIVNNITLHSENGLTAWKRAVAIYGKVPDKYDVSYNELDLPTKVYHAENDRDGYIEVDDSKKEVIVKVGENKITIKYDEDEGKMVELTAEEYDSIIESADKCLKENRQLKSDISRLEEKNKVLKKQIITLCKISDGVLKYVENVAEFHEFLETIRETAERYMDN